MRKHTQNLKTTYRVILLLLLMMLSIGCQTVLLDVRRPDLKHIEAEWSQAEQVKALAANYIELSEAYEDLLIQVEGADGQRIKIVQ